MATSTMLSSANMTFLKTNRNASSKIARQHLLSRPRAQRRLLVCASANTTLKDKKCEPCEECDDAIEYMGICGSMDRPDAEQLLGQVSDSWSIHEDSEGHLRLACNLRTHNFLKALELCNRIGDVAESEGHHPDLHIESWNKLRVEVWTHARKGLTENDFILAAKIDDIDKSDLLSKKKPKASFADT